MPNSAKIKPQIRFSLLFEVKEELKKFEAVVGSVEQPGLFRATKDTWAPSERLLLDARRVFNKRLGCAAARTSALSFHAFVQGVSGVRMFGDGRTGWSILRQSVRVTSYVDLAAFGLPCAMLCVAGHPFVHEPEATVHLFT